MNDRFEEAFRALYPAVRALAAQVLGDAEEADDAAQEAFAKLARHPVRDRPNPEVAAWLRRVCLNDSFNRLRTRKRAAERLERAVRLEPVPDGDHPLTHTVRREEQERVRSVLAGMPERQRVALLLRHSGYRYAEIADTIGVATTSVGTLLARAERAFAAAYEEHDHATLS